MKRLAMLAAVSLLGIRCAGTADPCERWAAERLCFTGAAVCNRGRVVVTCLDGEEAERYRDADPETVRAALNLEIGRVYNDAPECWACGELNEKGCLNQEEE